jgi:hypothetical protein
MCAGSNRETARRRLQHLWTLHSERAWLQLLGPNHCCLGLLLSMNITLHTLRTAIDTLVQNHAF